MDLINNDWNKILNDEFEKEYFNTLINFINDEYSNKIIYPPYEQIFNAFNLTSFEDTKVVILGQDPYINENQANGLAFSVNKTEKIPPSLKNVFKEIKSDVGLDLEHGDLTNWAKDGVLLLNAILTVENKKSKSHAKKGWETFTDTVIKKLNEKQNPIVFLLWGNDAKKKAKLITNKNHLVLVAPHPSPLARGGFFECKHFSKTNTFLVENNLSPVSWKN